MHGYNVFGDYCGVCECVCVFVHFTVISALGSVAIVLIVKIVHWILEVFWGWGS